MPSWFWIESHPQCVDGPKNLLKMIEFSRKLKLVVQNIAQKSIQRNGFYAHPEAFLQSMLAGEDQSLRKQAVEKSLAIRADLAKTTEEDEEEEEEDEVEEEDDWEDEVDIDAEELILDAAEKAAIQNSTVREFQVPKINFKATSYPNLINWKKATFTEPPMTLDLSDEELRGLVEKPLFVPPYPCHTQAVERAIKLVSEAAGSVVGADSRDGYIRQKIRSRKEVCLKGSKKNFFPKLEKE